MIICNALESIQQLSTCCAALMASSGPHGPNNALAIALGDMAHIPCDAYVVPSCGPFADFGNASITPSGGGNSRYVINTITTGIPFDDTNEAQKIVTLASKNALYQAKGNGLERIIFPPLGTDSFAMLTAEQSAKAIFRALFTFWDMEPEEGPHQVVVAIPNDRSVYKSFWEVMLQKVKDKMTIKRSPSHSN